MLKSKTGGGLSRPSVADMRRVLFKLEKEEYIDSVNKIIHEQSVITNTYYSTTFDGEFLIQNNGYKGLNKKEKRIKRWKLVEIIIFLPSAGSKIS